MEDIIFYGLYLLGLLGVIFTMRLYIRLGNTIDKLVVWISLIFSFVPFANFIVSAIYLFIIVFDWVLEKLDDMEYKRSMKNHRSFLEHLLGAEKDSWGDYQYKEKKKKETL